MSEDLGKLLLRLCLGGLLLFHGVHKLLNGLGPIEAMLAAHNISNTIAYGVYLGELVAPVLIILGFFSRIGGMLVVGDMIVAVLLVHVPYLLRLTPDTGGYALELQAFYLFSGLAVALLGAGRFSLGAGRWN
ncbi:MAG: DoxX family protein [Alphaproteobacteria bacterium]|nr:DoxX family protein [Alphaproteobacteria bacterium]MDE2111582.1 DoxX family protein [Alphaproteobacteria bacterium]MDE2493487.1 DoxX family protein [Alphaproteobacteria bacterium]